jgi:hypothetical protein
VSRNLLRAQSAASRVPPKILTYAQVCSGFRLPPLLAAWAPRDDFWTHLEVLTFDVRIPGYLSRAEAIISGTHLAIGRPESRQNQGSARRNWRWLWPVQRSDNPAGSDRSPLLPPACNECCEQTVRCRGNCPASSQRVLGSRTS